MTQAMIELDAMQALALNLFGQTTEARSLPGSGASADESISYLAGDLFDDLAFSHANPSVDQRPIGEAAAYVTGCIKEKAGEVIGDVFPGFKQRNALRDWTLLGAKTALTKDDRQRARAILCLWNFTDRVRAHGDLLEATIDFGEVCDVVEGWPRLEDEPMPTAQVTMALLRTKRPRKKTTKKAP